MSPRVSVVMPVRNGARFLREAVESILGQTLADIELVVVDDGSTDDSPRILQEYAAADARLQVLTQEPSGLGPALDRGCRHARAAYLARMDADDVSLPHRLETQARFLDEHPEVGLLGTAYVRIDTEGRPGRVVRYPTSPTRLQRELLRYNCFAHATVAFRREAYEQAGGYRLRNAEDYDLWLRIAERWALATLSEPLVRYRHHSGQFSVEEVGRQADAALAVQAAARARRRGEPDPLDGVDEPASALPLLGVSPWRLRASRTAAKLRVLLRR